MRILRRFLTFALIAGVGIGSAQSHHSAAMFDASKEVSISGAVKEFQFTNPHAWLIVSVPDSDGGQTNWSVELGAPTLIQGMGIKKSTFSPGDTVSVVLHPLKDGRPAGEFISVTLSDGTVVGH